MRSIYFTCLLFSAGVANGSDFEFCLLTGTVMSAPVAREGAQHFSLLITRAEPARCGIAESYQPEGCGVYQGKLIEVALPTDELQPPEKDSLLTLIQRVWYAELADNTGYRVAWQRPGTCYAITVESGQ